MFTCHKCGEVDKGHQVKYCWRCDWELYRWDKLNGKPPAPAYKKRQRNKPGRIK